MYDINGPPTFIRNFWINQMQVKLSGTSSWSEHFQIVSKWCAQSCKGAELKNGPSDKSLHTSSTATSYLKSATTSHKVLRHTPEAAKESRRRLYALSKYFGPHSLFFTVTPDAEYSFRLECMPIKGERSKFSVLNAMKLSVYKILSFDTRYPGACPLDHQAAL